MGIPERICRSSPKGYAPTWARRFSSLSVVGKAEHVKPFKGVGTGMFEIAERYSGDACRLVYGVQIGKHLYVLHAFQKKSKSGIATAQQDVDLIRKRYNDAKEHAKHDAEKD